MFDPSVVLDSASTVVTFLAQMPGENIQPQAPAGLGEKFDKGLNLTMYVCIALAIIGVLVAGATMVISRREGSSEEATAMALRIGGGCMLIGGAGALVTAFL